MALMDLQKEILPPRQYEAINTWRRTKCLQKAARRQQDGQTYTWRTRYGRSSSCRPLLSAVLPLPLRAAAPPPPSGPHLHPTSTPYKSVSLAESSPRLPDKRQLVSLRSNSSSSSSPFPKKALAIVPSSTLTWAHSSNGEAPRRAASASPVAGQREMAAGAAGALTAILQTLH